MKRIALITSVLALVLAGFTAQAGVKEKKAQKAAQAAIDDNIKKAAEACGCKGLKATIDFAAYKYYEHLRMSQYRIPEIFSGMVELCKDKDYKEEVAKIKVLKLYGAKDNPKKPIFKLKGTTIEVGLSFTYSAMSGEVRDKMKELF